MEKRKSSRAPRESQVSAARKAALILPADCQWLAGWSQQRWRQLHTTDTTTSKFKFFYPDWFHSQLGAAHPPVLRGAASAPPSGALLSLPACPLRQTHLVSTLHSSHCPVCPQRLRAVKGPSVSPEVSRPAALFSDPHVPLIGLQPVRCCKCVGKQALEFKAKRQ